MLLNCLTEPAFCFIWNLLFWGFAPTIVLIFSLFKLNVFCVEGQCIFTLGAFSHQQCLTASKLFVWQVKNCGNITMWCHLFDVGHCMRSQITDHIMIGHITFYKRHVWVMLRVPIRSSAFVTRWPWSPVNWSYSSPLFDMSTPLYWFISFNKAF